MKRIRCNSVAAVYLIFIIGLHAQEQGWYTSSSKDPTADAINIPDQVNSDLSYIPQNIASIISQRRAPLLAVVNNAKVIPLIRLKIIRLLLETWDIDQDHKITEKEKLMLEGVKYGIITPVNYAKSMKILSSVIIIYNLPHTAEECFSSLREAGWDVNIDDIKYSLTNIIPKVTIIQ
jgi:hypothetical protein